MKGEEVNESAIPQLPEDSNAPKRFEHTRDGKAKRVHTLASRYGHLANNNVSITKFNTLEALKEKYDKKPAAVKVKKEESSEAGAASAKLPTTTAQRRSRGRDRTSRSVTGSSSADAVKVEDDEEMGDATAASADEPVDIDDDAVRYGEFGKPAHERAGQAKIRSKLARKRSKSKAKGGFLNWHNLAASS